MRLPARQDGFQNRDKAYQICNRPIELTRRQFIKEKFNGLFNDIQSSPCTRIR